MCEQRATLHFLGGVVEECDREHTTRGRTSLVPLKATLICEIPWLIRGLVEEAANVNQGRCDLTRAPYLR